MPATVVNGQNCKKIVLGTGTVDCEIKLSQPYSIIRVPNNWSFNVTTSGPGFNLEYAIQQTQGGVFAPFLKTLEFTDNTPDPTTEEFQGGSTAVIRNGKPTYQMRFNNGIGFHKAAYSYNGFGTNSVLLVDKTGNVWGQLNDAGTVFKAFPTSMFNTQSFRPTAGDTSSRTLIDFQISDEEAFNRNLAVISRDDIGANLNEDLLGYVSVNIKIVSADVSDGVVIVDVTAVNNSTTGIQSLTVNDFDLVNVTADTISGMTTVVESTTKAGRYTLTPTTMPTAGQVIQIQTKQYGLNQAARISGTNLLYKGISSTFTAVA